VPELRERQRAVVEPDHRVLHGRDRVERGQAAGAEGKVSYQRVNLTII